MTPHADTLGAAGFGLATAALVLAAAALVLAAIVMRQNADTTRTVRRLPRAVQAISDRVDDLVDWATAADVAIYPDDRPHLAPDEPSTYVDPAGPAPDDLAAEIRDVVAEIRADYATGRGDPTDAAPRDVVPPPTTEMPAADRPRPDRPTP